MIIALYYIELERQYRDLWQ